MTGCARARSAAGRSRAARCLRRSAPAALPRQHAETRDVRSADGDGRVTLKHGETIYTLSRRYGVPAQAIMRANGITSASDVTAGRQILIPAHDGSAARQPMEDRTMGHATVAARPAVRPLMVPGRTERVAVLSDGGKADIGHSGGSAARPAPKAGSDGAYVVKSGDTLAGISRRTNISIDALKSANNLSGSAIRIGQRLALPQGAEAPAAPAKAAPKQEVVTGSTPKPAPEPAKVAAAAPKTARQEPAPKAYSPPAKKEEQDVAAAGSDAKAKVASLTPESSGIGKLRWPARGQIVARFGSTEDGHRNDGIDISVPEGTPVKAAENGVVIYSGSGLKEYGNTVLIRHDDGLVTVYGYAKDLKVKRGDKVTRGQVIADSGMSGEANRPKLHFEVRKDATPVNPSTYLD